MNGSTREYERTWEAIVIALFLSLSTLIVTVSVEMGIYKPTDSCPMFGVFSHFYGLHPCASGETKLALLVRPSDGQEFLWKASRVGHGFRWQHDYAREYEMPKFCLDGCEVETLYDQAGGTDMTQSNENQRPKVEERFGRVFMRFSDYSSLEAAHPSLDVLGMP